MDEVEIKFRVRDAKALREAAQQAGFELETPSTMERNTLLDTPDRALRGRGELLRVREYGGAWVLTHKRHPTEEELHGRDARHKVRVETESRVEDGEAIFGIFAALGLTPVFTYEKFREEWSEREGCLVLDETPLGMFAELEGPHGWIDAMAARLGVGERDYIVDSYGTLFLKWREETGADAQNMTFAEVGARELAVK